MVMREGELVPLSADWGAMDRNRNRKKQQEEIARNREIDLARVKKQSTCFEECNRANGLRMDKYDQLKQDRETVKKNCSSTGTVHPGEIDIATTSEDSPSAHNRIVRDEATDKLVYLERRINVVRVKPKWTCSKKFLSTLGEDERERVIDASENWMYDMPPFLYQKDCSKITGNTSSFRQLPLDVCIRWTHTSGVN